jgi:hypothetical protein
MVIDALVVALCILSIGVLLFRSRLALSAVPAGAVVGFNCTRIAARARTEKENSFILLGGGDEETVISFYPYTMATRLHAL